jgi:hypothetical protein
MHPKSTIVLGRPKFVLLADVFQNYKSLGLSFQSEYKCKLFDKELYGGDGYLIVVLDIARLYHREKSRRLYYQQLYISFYTRG